MKKILSIEVKNSSFFKNPIKIEFNDHLNCLMGGRGTGKSTLLYMLQSTIESDAEYDKNIYSILKANLGVGCITVTLEDNDGIKYKIDKTFNDDPQPYKIPSGDHVPINRILNDVNCDIYGTSALEQIGLNGKDRLILIDKMNPDTIPRLYTKLESGKYDLDDNANSIKTEYGKVIQLQNNLEVFEGAEEAFTAHKKDPPKDIEDDDQQKFENADKEEKQRAEESRFISNISDKTTYLLNHVNEISEELLGFLNYLEEDREILNKEIIEPAIKTTKGIIGSVNELNNSIKKELDTINTNFSKTKLNLDVLHEKQQNEFVILKQTFDKHKTYIDKYNQLSKEVDEKKAKEKNLKEANTKLEQVLKKRQLLVNNYNSTKQSIYNERLKSIEKLNTEFAGAIRITLTFGGITDEYEKLLRNALQGSGMQYNVLIPSIVQNISPDKFASIIQNSNFESLKNVTGIDEARSKALIHALKDTDEILKIESLYTPDLPEFLLRMEDKKDVSGSASENYHPTDQLSTGQRCTTVLPIVFAVSNNPLFIDQPEDNLDNKYISETIHKMIQNLKGTRQLIFITHNPNIPVLAYSEQNVFLQYLNKKSDILNQGSVEDVKENILKLLEGGREAFKTRSKLYGE